MSEMTLEQAETVFGFKPTGIGMRHRGWWVIDQPDEDDLDAGAQAGDLIVRARDGGSNPIDMDALKHENAINTVEDGFDCTYRYYYYRPLGIRQVLDSADCASD